MIDGVWYNRNANLDNYGLLTQANNCDIVQKPALGGLCVFGYPYIPVAGERESRVRGTEVAQIGFLCV